MDNFVHQSLRNAKLYLKLTAIPYENLNLDFQIIMVQPLKPLLISSNFIWVKKTMEL